MLLGVVFGFERILYQQPVAIGGSITVDSRFSGIYFFIDPDCACVYMVLKAGMWSTVPASLENTSALGYNFSVSNGNLIASHNKEGVFMQGLLTCWVLRG